MLDFAVSDSDEVQRQLDRLCDQSPPHGRLSLDPIRRLLRQLGNPERQLPPVFHVAGTNGKGSTCTFLRSMLEAQGLAVHTATKPHLVRYNERIRLSGELISDPLLADLLREVIDVAGDTRPTFFEVTTAATFLAFARIKADACVIETGLGGRLDATNVIEAPAACGIASLGIDHEAFLLSPEEGVPQDPLARIAFEKASIAKPGSPLITQRYPGSAALVVQNVAAKAGAPLVSRGRDWDFDVDDELHYRDREGELDLPLPSLIGGHQSENAALAAAMVRHQDRVPVSASSIAKGILGANWPARLQRLGIGPLTALAGNRAIWLDGGHNPDAGRALAAHFEGGKPIHLIIGMLENKNPAAIVEPLSSRLASISCVAVPGHASHGADAFSRGTGLQAKSRTSVRAALLALPPDGEVLIAGSLYLAGQVLKDNQEVPR